MNLGERIRDLRKKKYTQEELAELVGVHVNTLIRWEHGDRNPTADKLQALANALGTSMESLLSDTGDPAPQIIHIRNETPAERSVIEKNRGVLTYTSKNGDRVELPDTDKGYELFREILKQNAVVA